MSDIEKSYLKGLETIYKFGKDLPIERVNTTCRTYINIGLVIDASTEKAPILTTRNINYKAAIAELIGYLRGYTSAEQFRALGTKTWDANANLNKSWLANPHRKGEDDLGPIYGAVARNYPIIDIDANGQRAVREKSLDLLTKTYNNLKAKKDDRGETLSDTLQQHFSFNF